jgi:argininosuccinate lyase
MQNQILKNKNTKLLDEFNASLNFDKKLYEYDILGSIAHSKMLAIQGIISLEEQEQIEKGLLQIKNEIKNNRFKFDITDEDIHMAIEKRLTILIGESAKKLHTARSRNDQVALDFTMYVLDNASKIKIKIIDFITVLLSLAKEHIDTLLPGMTHLQHAQPVSFAFYLLAYIAMFKRDIERFESLIERNNYNPLGSAALAGTPHNIDRFETTKLLNFKAPTLNAMDTVSNRDFAIDILYNIAVSMMHLSRFSEELILWSSYEFKFIEICDEYATTSSIMPQKKNPDVPELLRGKTGRVYGNLISLLTVMKGLPLAYNKDTQEDKESVFDSVETALISFEIAAQMTKCIKVNKSNMLKACKIGHLTATDFADFLVKEYNLPFREAYYITKDVVSVANNLNKDISELTLDEIKSANKKLNNIDNKVLKVLDLKNSANSRNSFGGTSQNQVIKQIDIIQKWLKEI